MILSSFYFSVAFQHAYVTLPPFTKSTFYFLFVARAFKKHTHLCVLMGHFSQAPGQQRPLQGSESAPLFTPPP
jgi:hypothetical protein